ncbi:hypothetical protein TNCV_1769151 [Trichonephila clavipes]|nr:hypothetical protein TNCV_1769151 [Trichonephila clavipes]
MSSNTRCSGLSRQRGQVAGRNYPPTNKNTLIRALTEEWDKLTRQLLDNVVQNQIDFCIGEEGGVALESSPRAIGDEPRRFECESRIALHTTPMRGIGASIFMCINLTTGVAESSGSRNWDPRQFRVMCSNPGATKDPRRESSHSYGVEVWYQLKLITCPKCKIISNDEEFPTIEKLKMGN